MRNPCLLVLRCGQGLLEFDEAPGHLGKRVVERIAHRLTGLGKRLE